MMALGTLVTNANKLLLLREQLGHLQVHKEAKHAGNRCPCDYRDYSATTLGRLKRNKNLSTRVLDRYP